MTDAQIRFFQMKETKRHNQEQERIWVDQLKETNRSNLAHEGLTQQQIETQAATSRYVADTNAATSRYSTDVNAETQRHSIDVNAETQRYVSDQNAATSRYATDKQAETSTYSTDVNAETSRYRTDVESADRQARLDFDRETQDIRNEFERRRVELAELQGAQDIEESKRRVKKMIADTQHDTQRLYNEATRLGLDEKAAKYKNALTAMQAFQASSQAMKNYVDTTANFMKLLTAIGAM